MRCLESCSVDFSLPSIELVDFAKPYAAVVAVSTREVCSFEIIKLKRDGD